VGQQAPAHPSPNAGVIEAAFAAALGIRMGGLNHYPGGPEDRPALGSGPPPEARHIAEACRLSRHATAAMCATSLVVTAVAAGVGRSR
jgi:adenosylcobinamide-phosphate synthase